MSNKKKLLIVDDDEQLLKALSEKCIHEGFDVLLARDGDEGLESALTNKPDLIILDIVMPKMDGKVMLSKLRQDPWGQNVQVVMLTNCSGSEDISHAMNEKIACYLIKSNTELSEIIEKIKSILND